MGDMGIVGLVGLGLLALVPVVTLAVRAERDVTSLLTLYCALLFLIPAQWVVGPIGAAGTPAMLVALAAAWWWVAGRLHAGLGLDLSPQPVRVAVLGHGWFMLLTYGVMWMRPLTELEVSGANRALIALVALSGVALLAADGITSRARLDTLLRRVVVLTAVVAAIAVVQFLTSFDPVRLIQVPGLRLNQRIIGIGGRSIFNRPFSTTLHPIELSVVLAMVLPLALHFALHARTRAAQLRWWPPAVLIAAGIPISLSRSGVVGVAIGMIVLSLAWSWRRRLNAAVAAVGFTAVLWATIPGLVGTIRGLFTGLADDPSIQARTERVPRMLELLVQRPWFGRGMGTYSVEDYFLLDNQYYVSAIEVGIIGVVVILAMFFTAMAVGWALWRRVPGEETRHLAVALAAGVSVVIVSIATFDAFFYNIFSGLAFLLVGALGALWRLAKVPPADVMVPAPAAARRGV